VSIISWIVDLIRDPGALITWGGYPGLALIIFVETGALVFFLPGDSLLVMAGLYAAKGDLSIVALNLLLIPCAVIGDATSYYIGAKSGPHLFNRPRSRLFRPEHLRAAHDFYERHGGKAILSMTLLGYVLGSQFPLLVRHIEKVIIVIVLLSIAPGVVEWLKARRRARLAPPVAGAPSER
jgi:membrane-associated protein